MSSSCADKTVLRQTVYVSRFASWAPGCNSPGDWQEWAAGNRAITKTRESPELSFTDPLFRRRLSQISRMTIQVLHDILPVGQDTKITFVSFRGEITQQFKINKMLIQEQDIKPASFSLSVFNTPPAVAAIALHLTAGYSAIYPAQNRFDTGFWSAALPVLCGEARETVLVYADELCPAEYGDLCPGPLAFAALLSLEQDRSSIPAQVCSLESPQRFLQHLYQYQFSRAEDR